MANPDEKVRHRKHLQSKRKKKPPVRSPQAKALENPLYHQRIVRDKRGKLHDLEKMTFRELVEEIQE